MVRMKESNPIYVQSSNKSKYEYGPPYHRDEYLEKKLLLECKKSKGISKNKIERLLRIFKVDPSHASEDGNQAIHQASKNGKSKIVLTLLKAGADPEARNIHGQTPLMICSKGCTRGHLKCVKFLLKERVDVDAVDCEGGTALRQAILGSSLNVVELLLMHNPNLHWDEEIISCQNIRDKGIPVALSFAIGMSTTKMERVSTKDLDDIDQLLDNLEKRRKAKRWIPFLAQQRIVSKSDSIVQAVFNHVVNQGCMYK